MIKIKFIFAIALLCPMSTQVCAQTSNSKTGITLERIMKSGAKQFDKLDLNHDGVVDEAEWSAHVEELVAKLRTSQSKRWEDMDSGKLKHISKQEFLNSRAKWFADVDTDGSGMIDSDKIRLYNYARSKAAPE